MADTYTIDAKGRAFIDKDPDATLDYTFDWTAWLDAIGDSIASAECAGNGVEVTATTVVGKKVVAWVQGGTVDETATVTCRVSTADGRTDDRTIYLKIKER